MADVKVPRRYHRRGRRPVNRDIQDDHPNVTKEQRKRNVRRFLGFVKPYTGIVLEALACLMIISGLNIAMPQAMRIIIDQVFPNGDMGLLAIVLGGILLVFILRAMFSYVAQFLIVYAGQRIVFDMRRRLFRHLQRLSLGFYEARKSGKILSRVMNDVGSLQQLVNAGFINLVINIVTLFTVLVIIFSMNWKLALISIWVFPVHAAIYRFFRQRVSKTSRSVREKFAAITGNLSEVIVGAKVVKGFTAETREAKMFTGDLRDGMDLRMNLVNINIWWSILANFVVGLGTMTVLWFGSLYVVRQSMSPGQFLAFYSYVAMLYSPVISLVSMLTVILDAMTGLDRVFDILDTRPEVEEDPNPVKLEHLRGEIEFRNVSFAYEQGGEDVLKDISFHAAPGEVVAFVGPSGSGKTTIANLIARFYDRKSGEILVDGIDIKKLSLKQYRDKLGIVLQDNFLFTGTIADNIRYGRPDATDEEIIEAAKMANAHDFIMELPDQYESEVGENGAKLSGGQKQRLAIARAILRNPRILILDEATSSLDTASEIMIQEALENLMRGRTTFVIAHRLSTVRNADKIIVLRNGQIEQMGTHEELLAEEGLYRQLYEPQINMQIDPAFKVALRKIA